jgi:hypothetical protein
MVRYAALVTTTGSGVVVDTTMKVNVQMAVWEVEYFGCKLEYNRTRWWLRQTSTRSSYPGSVSALVANDAPSDTGSGKYQMLRLVRYCVSKE